MTKNQIDKKYLQEVLSELLIIVDRSLESSDSEFTRNALDLQKQRLNDSSKIIDTYEGLDYLALNNISITFSGVANYFGSSLSKDLMDKVENISKEASKSGKATSKAEKRVIYSGTFAERVQQAIEDKPEYKKISDSEVSILCIKHDDKNTGSFLINMEKEGFPCHCYSCHFSGNIKDLAKHFEITMTGRDWLEAKLDGYSKHTYDTINALVKDSTYKVKGATYDSILINGIQNIFYDSEGRKQTPFKKGSTIDDIALEFKGSARPGTIYIVEGLSSAFPYIECGLNVIVAGSKGHLRTMYEKTIKEARFTDVVASLDLDDDYREQIKHYAKSVIFLGTNKGNDAWDCYNDEGKQAFLKVLEEPIIYQPKENKSTLKEFFEGEWLLSYEQNTSYSLIAKGEHHIEKSVFLPQIFETILKICNIDGLYVSQDEISKYKIRPQYVDKDYLEDGGSVIVSSKIVKLNYKILEHKSVSPLNNMAIEFNLQDKIIAGGFTVENSLATEYLSTARSSGKLIVNMQGESLRRPYPYAKEGDWSYIKAWLSSLVENDSNMLDQLLNIYAHKMQQPEQKLDIIILMIDKGGTGKTSFMQLLSFFNDGRAGLVSINSKSPDYSVIEDKRFIYADEVEYSQELYTNMKLITNSIVQSDTKYERVKQIHNYSLMHCLSNKLSLLDFSGEGTRRYFPLISRQERTLEPTMQKIQGGQEFMQGFLSLAKYISTDGRTFDRSKYTFDNNQQVALSQIDAFAHYLLNLKLVPINTSINKHMIALMKDREAKQLFSVVAEDLDYEIAQINKSNMSDKSKGYIDIVDSILNNVKDKDKANFYNSRAIERGLASVTLDERKLIIRIAADQLAKVSIKGAGSLAKLIDNPEIGITAEAKSAKIQGKTKHSLFITYEYVKEEENGVNEND